MIYKVLRINKVQESPPLWIVFLKPNKVLFITKDGEEYALCKGESFIFLPAPELSPLNLKFIKHIETFPLEGGTIDTE